MTGKTMDREEEIIECLLKFVKKATNDLATDKQIEVLPVVADVLRKMLE